MVKVTADIVPDESGDCPRHELGSQTNRKWRFLKLYFYSFILININFNDKSLFRKINAVC